MSRGCLIIFEGIDGSGKSEQSGRLIKKLKEEYEIVSTFEPTKTTPIGRLIRKILYENEEIAEEALALLFAADRVDHTEKKIKPALKEGKIVISDRYVYSSLAYQSKGMKKELNLNWIKMINKFAIEPDIVIFLDITPEIGQNRLANGQIRVKDHTYFNDIIQQEKIRSEYYQILNLEKKDLRDFTDNKNRGNEVEISKICNTTVFRINGTLTEDRIEKIIRDNVKKLLKEKGIEKLDKTSNLENKSLPQFTGA